MRHEQQLQVEVYSHGGWWKDSQGRTGQVTPDQANKGPMATVAVVANGFGVEGWELTDLVSAHHNTYLLTFLHHANGDTTQTGETVRRRDVTTSVG